MEETISHCGFCAPQKLIGGFFLVAQRDLARILLNFSDPQTKSGKSKWGLSKWGLKVLVHNCPRLPTIVVIL